MDASLAFIVRGSSVPFPGAEILATVPLCGFSLIILGSFILDSFIYSRSMMEGFI